uniref:Eph LBD domain-containing protein n=1 Tax=Petromyzon marinus TaxID=7757 RepID=S4R4K2_PETMA
WEEFSRIRDRNIPHCFYQVRNVMNQNQNWLRAHWIWRDGVQRAYVELKFTPDDCNSVQSVALTCKEMFNLLLQEQPPTRKPSTIAANQTFKHVDVADHMLKLNTEVRKTGPLSRKGFFVAFHDMGACMALMSMRVYFKKCPAVVCAFASFPDKSSSLVEVSGLCVPNSVASDDPRMYCSKDGEWLVPVGQHMCRPGYGANGGICTACPLSYYKKTPAIQKTPACCLHEASYYEAGSDAVNMTYTRPQQGRAITWSVNETSALLEWSPPGRRRSPPVPHLRWQGQCALLCGGGVHFLPGHEGLTVPGVTIVRLLAHTNYSFHIEALNRVS